jgi:hypothetical protein
MDHAHSIDGGSAATRRTTPSSQCAALLAVLATLLAPAGRAAEIQADPSNYQNLADQLQPGDTLRLAPGSYTRLSLGSLHGEPDRWITITGPESGAPAVIEGEPGHNTVQIRASSYLVLRNLRVDSRNIDGLDGINAKDGASHHIVLENNTIVGAGGSQQTVGISTKAPAWNWVIRNNRILEAGTGLYLGAHSGGDPFIAGIVEGNLVLNPTGYGMQIKHQDPYDIPQAPAGPNVTIIRNNVFIKDDRPNEDGSRPNLLVGTFPASGQGSSDRYEIYGNFIYHNPRESLIQATGRVSIHDNLLVDAGEGEAAILLTDHNGELRLAHVYNNTIYTTSRGIRFAQPARDGDRVIGNLVFAGTPISGQVGQSRDNLTFPPDQAAQHVQQPSAVLGEMDFYPLPGQCQGAPLDYPAELLVETDHEFDFNGASKGAFTFRGAYAGEGSNPGWQPSATRKTGGPSSDPGDPPTDPPEPPTNLRVN